MEKSQNQLWNFNENDDERSFDENDGERNIDEFETDDNLFNDQESKLPNYNEPIFICDYPTSSIIELIYYEANGKQHKRSYNILSLGNYPSNVKYTQRSKKNSPVYKIPDKYKVETVLGGFSIICVANGFYKIIGMKASSKVSGVLLFGFNIPDLIEVRENVNMPIIINKKRPYTKVSTSQKNRRLHSLAKDFKTQSTVILKNNNINNSQLRLIELEIDGKIVVIDFQSRSTFDFITHCDAVLQAIDECLISRQEYRRLAMVDPNIEREYHIEDRKHQINKIMYSLIPIHSNYTIKITSSSLDQSRENLDPPNINSNNTQNNNNNQNGLCSFRSIKDLLNILVPIWKKGSSPILVFGDTIKLKLGGDGHIVTNQYSHIMFTVCLLNEKLSILLYIGKEKYEYLSLAVSQIINELDEIKDGFKDCDDVIWTVELFFSGDWKFMALVMGIKAANSNFFCLYCEYSKELCSNMNHSWNITGNKKDINQFKKSISILIEQEMHQIGLTHFQFYESKTKSKYNWTMLNGTEKLNVLENFEVSKFVSAAKSWILKFCEPTVEKSNSTNQKRGMFNPTDITPYMHILTCHIPQFLHILKSKNLQFRHFSTSSLEKKNHMHVRIFFGATTMGGGNKANSVVHDILIYEN
ncbi:hypothetical protein C1646_768948 [Rhizophagus diaphanus]|nr:hypothetical protein C1646_768948 [Rhizophagus diaphanus] [Rhizophagus sp. MUCL 43196]